MSKVGRPTKYQPQMCERVVELMRGGVSKTEVAAELDISWETLSRWQEEIPSFCEAVKRGEGLSKAWWEREARISLRDKDFNATLWYMNMKNRFGWRDKQEIESTGTLNHNINVVNVEAGNDPYKKIETS